MFSQIKEFVKNNQWAQLVLMLVAGMAIGALFYPTKHIEERERQKHEEETKILKETYSKELSQVKESLDKTVSEAKQYKKETERKITTLTTEITTLKSRQRTAYYKLIRPDGTIEIKRFTETEVDESTKVITSIREEFNEKVASIETKWENIHKERMSSVQKEFKSKEEEYKHRIDELERSRVVDINKKSFGLEVGALTNKDYYGHASYDVFGPFFLGLHTQLGLQPAAGGGLGFRF